MSPDITLNIADTGLNDDGGIDPAAGRPGAPPFPNFQFPNDCRIGQPGCRFAQNNQTTSPTDLGQGGNYGGQDNNNESQSNTDQ